MGGAPVGMVKGVAVGENMELSNLSCLGVVGKPDGKVWMELVEAGEVHLRSGLGVVEEAGRRTPVSMAIVVVEESLDHLYCDCWLWAAEGEGEDSQRRRGILTIGLGSEVERLIGRRSPRVMPFHFIAEPEYFSSMLPEFLKMVIQRKTPFLPLSADTICVLNEFAGAEVGMSGSLNILDAL